LSAISLKDYRNFVQFLHRNVGLLPKNILRFSTSKSLRNTRSTTTSTVQLTLKCN